MCLLQSRSQSPRYPCSAERETLLGSRIEFTNARRGPRGPCPLKNEYIFYLRISRYFQVICLSLSKQNPEHSNKFKIKLVVYFLQATQNLILRLGRKGNV